jgi:hypothetical protein
MPGVIGMAAVVCVALMLPMSFVSRMVVLTAFRIMSALRVMPFIGSVSLMLARGGMT